MATRKITYAADVQLTISPQNVATSSTLLAGVESDVVDNSSNLYLDYLISGKWTCGTTPTINTNVQICVVAPIDDAPEWPDVFDGTASAETITSAGIKLACVRVGATILVDATTSDRTYPFAPFSVASLFGGVCPQKFVVFVTHNTGVNSNSTAGNHEVTIQGIYETIA